MPPWRRFDVRHLAIVLIVLIYTAVLYDVDPIVGYFNRHFLAAFAPLLVVAVVGMLSLIRVLFPSACSQNNEMLLAAVMLVVTAVQTADNRATLVHDAAYYARRMAAREDLANWIGRRLAPEESCLIGDTGLVPYLTNSGVIDAYCLNCAEMTRPPIDGSAAKFVEMVFSRRPAMIVVHSSDPQELEPHEYYGIYPLLIRHPSFNAEYHHVTTFGAVGDEFHYWVFEHKARGRQADG